MKRIALALSLILCGAPTPTLVTSPAAYATVPSDSSTIAGLYLCDGSDTTFTIPSTLGLSDDDDLQVILITESTGSETVLTKTTHYTIAGANTNDPSDLTQGGTVTTTTAYSSEYQILLRRDTAKTQTVNIDDEEVEEALDKLTWIVQELAFQLGLCIQIQPSESGDTVKLQPAGTAGYIYRASNGNFSTVAGVVAGDTPSTSYWANVLAQADLDASLDAMTAGQFIRDRISDANDAEFAVGTHSGTYNVMHRGATGDGVTNDSAAIQAAIDAAAAAATSGSDVGEVILPPGVYNLGTTGLSVPGYVHLRGLGRPYLAYSGTGFAVTLAGSQSVISRVNIQVDTAAGQSDYFGGIKIYAAAAQTSKNVIELCMVQGTAAGSQVDPYGVGVYIAGASETYPSYFNEIDRCVIRRFCRGTLHHDAANQTKYRGGLVEYYTLYGVDLAGSDENQMEGTFFQQAAGTGVYGLTYAVHLGATAVLNQLSFGAEPGTYSSPLLCENSGNLVHSVNANGTYAVETDGLLPSWTTSGNFTTSTISATESARVFDHESLGDEMIVNGDFATAPDTAWTWGTGWTLTDEKAVFAGGGTGSLSQSLDLKVGYAYCISVTLAGDADSGVRVYYNGTNSFRVQPNTTKTLYFVVDTGGSTFTITPPATFSGSVDDVSVKRITGGTLTVQGPVIANGGFVEDVNNVSADVVAFGTHGVHIINSSGGAISGTLADGEMIGQTVDFVCATAGNNIDVVVAHCASASPETIRMDTAGECFSLVWSGTVWVIRNWVGVTYP